MDRIKIQELEVFANHGVYPEENALGQKFVISADLYTDTAPRGKAMIWSSPSTMERCAGGSKNTWKAIPGSCWRAWRSIWPLNF